MEKLILEPVQAGYATQPPTEVLRQQLDGGAGRYRADIIGGASIVNVAWVLDEGQYQYLWAFFRAKTARGSSSFLIDLVLEETEMTERTAHFLPGTLKLDSKQGEVYFASAQIEIEAIEADDDFDNAIADAFEGAGGVDVPGYLNLLNTLVNVNWPEES
jgi:hypothetical protein